MDNAEGWRQYYARFTSNFSYVDFIHAIAPLFCQNAFALLTKLDYGNMKNVLSPINRAGAGW